MVYSHSLLVIENDQGKGCIILPAPFNFDVTNSPELHNALAKRISIQLQ